MRKDYVHITLVCDESGSMFSSRDEVTSGVKKIIDEQKSNKEGKVTISLYKFNDEVKEEFVGKDVNDEIKFHRAEYLREPFKLIKSNADKPEFFIALIPLVRNLIEYTKDTNSDPAKSVFP